MHKNALEYAVSRGEVTKKFSGGGLFAYGCTSAAKIMAMPMHRHKHTNTEIDTERARYAQIHTHTVGS